MRKQISRLNTVQKGRGKLEFIYIDGPLPAAEDNPMRAEQEQFFKGMDFFDFARWVDDDEDQHEAKRAMAALQKRFPDMNDMKNHLNNHPEDRLAINAPRKYLGLEPALAFLQKQLRAHAPVDGVLGFSQGANFANILAAQAEAGEGVPISFVVHICPGRPGWTRQKPEIFRRPLATRSLHISGEWDMNPPLALKHLYEAPACVMHEDAHRPIPGTRAEEANRIARVIVDFILNEPLADAVLSPQAADAKAPPPGPPQEFTMTVVIDRDLDIKEERTVTEGTSVWDLKEEIAKEDPTETCRPEHFDLAKPGPGGGEMLEDTYLITKDDKELEIYIP